VGSLSGSLLLQCISFVLCFCKFVLVNRDIVSKLDVLGTVLGLVVKCAPCQTRKASCLPWLLYLFFSVCVFVCCRFFKTLIDGCVLLGARMQKFN
jgi:hypothetical protein